MSSPECSPFLCGITILHNYNAALAASFTLGITVRPVFFVLTAGAFNADFYIINSRKLKLAAV
jgi:hypothetical protein